MSLGGGVALTDIAGVDAQGRVPTRFSDECRAALAAVATLLGARGLSLHDVRHLACTTRDADAFVQVQGLMGDALGPARPSVTLRIVNRFALGEQRIALSVVAVP